VLTGIEEANNSTLFEVYPNPVRSVLSIKSVVGENIRVCLSDASGRIIRSLNFSSGIQNIDMTAVSPGIYFITCSASKGISTFKIIHE
jgi:hypothetical protein